jgi:hypothetical protein
MALTGSCLTAGAETTLYADLLRGIDYGDEVTWVIGHKSPDADTVGSAMAYAWLLRQPQLRDDEFEGYPGITREGAHRVYAECAPRNSPSRKLPEKAGLKREAHLRQNIRFHRDEYGMPVRKDTLICAMPESDNSTIGSMI